MKKIIIVIGLLFLILPAAVIAQGQGNLEKGSGQSDAVVTGNEDQAVDVPPRGKSQESNQSGKPTGGDETNGEAGQAQIQIQQQQKNAGEESQLQNRNENALQNMSQVAKQVQELLQNREEDEGIGQQIREVARQQSRSQEIVSQSLEANKNRSPILQYVLGPDRKAVGAIEKQIEENKERASKLQSLQEDATPAEEELIKFFNSSIEEVNDSLNQQLETYQQQFSLIGWLQQLIG